MAEAASATILPFVPPIPVRTRIDVRLEALRNWHGNDEKVATTALKEMKVRGVRLTSRYDQAHEYRNMAAALMFLDKDQCGWIKELFCDSKATHSYVMTMVFPGEVHAQRIADQLCYAFRMVAGGHNGIFVRDREAHADPWWVFDDEENDSA